MKALCYTRPLAIGEFESALEMQDVSMPEPAEGQLLVRMRASSINIDDIHIAEGTFLGGMQKSQASQEQPSTPGVDVAGIVEKLGANVSGFAVGDEVLGILGPKPGRGAWAEYCCLPAVMALKKPAAYSFEEAAASGVAGKTAANAVTSAALQPGQAALVVGASGGIGSLVVQILKQQGVRIIGVCSGRNAALVGSLGAETIIDYTRGPFGEQLGSVKVDVVIDCVGGRDVEKQGLRVLNRQGRFVTLVGPHSFIGETRIGTTGIIAYLAYVSRRSMLSRIFGPRYLMAGIGRSLESLQKLVLDNCITPPIDRELPFELGAIRDGIAHVRSHRARGKVVITIAQG
jgi:NADPH:quinone reductase-like Zn-dependent oxidoreductase